MSRTLRRLAAGAVVAGTLLVLAPQAQASLRCFDVRDPRGMVHRVCV